MWSYRAKRLNQLPIFSIFPGFSRRLDSPRCVKNHLDDSLPGCRSASYFGAMPSLPHSRPVRCTHRFTRRTNRRSSSAAAIIVAALLASGCSPGGDDTTTLAELEPVTIGTDVEQTGFEPPAETIPAKASADTEKVIVRRPVERFALDVASTGAHDFGEVDIDVLTQTAGTKVDYAVHPSALSIKDGKNDHSLRQRFDPSTDGSPRVEFAASIPDADDESWLSYRIYFEPRFEWNKGGKLPGLAGGTHPTFEGGDGTDGFSARMAWMPKGQMGVYLYHPDRPEELGELRGTFGTFERKQWHTITQRVVMNSDGLSDGILEVWLDELLVFSDSNMNWRTTGDFGADVFLYSAFYGGGSVDWAPDTTNFVRFADITVSTTDNNLQTFSR